MNTLKTPCFFRKLDLQAGPAERQPPILAPDNSFARGLLFFTLVDHGGHDHDPQKAGQRDIHVARRLGLRYMFDVRLDRVSRE